MVPYWVTVSRHCVLKERPFGKSNKCHSNQTALFCVIVSENVCIRIRNVFISTITGRRIKYFPGTFINKKFILLKTIKTHDVKLSCSNLAYENEIILPILVNHLESRPNCRLEMIDE